MPKQFFLLSEWNSNTGPTNVNRSLVLNSDKDMSYLHSSNRIIKRLERFKSIFYPVVVISGVCTDLEIRLLKFFRKKIIYIMHGCISYEIKVNKLTLSKKYLELENRILSASDVIVCVSERYSEWVKKEFPQYANKIKFINNGITLNQRPLEQKEQYSIAVSGGNRLQKNNGIVCKAVEKLNAMGYDCNMYVFGRMYENNDNLSYPFVHYMGHMNKEEYYNALDKISLFVLNSILESFGLVVADALNCNCSLLMSKGVGALSIMSTTDNDVIKDCTDVDEIALKILFLLQNPNYKALYNSIDFEDASEKSSYLKLKQIVNEI